MRGAAYHVIASVFASALAAIAAFEWLVDNRIGLVVEVDDVARPLYAPALPSHTKTQRYKVFDGGFDRTRLLSATYHFDQFGARAERETSSYDRGLTFAMIGDSFTFGAENDYENTLQGKLSRSFSNVNFANFGRSGISSADFADCARLFLLRFPRKLDGLIVGVFSDMQGGDIPRMRAFQRFGPMMMFHGVPVSGPRYKQISASRMARFIFRAEAFLRQHSSTYNTLFPPAAAEGFAVPLGGELLPFQMAQLRDAFLEKLARLASVTGVPPERTIVWSVASAFDTRVRKTAEPSAQLDRSDKFWEETFQRLRSLGYSVVNSQRMIESLYLESSQFPFTASGHYLPIAYDVTAHALIPEIERVLNQAYAAPAR